MIRFISSLFGRSALRPAATVRRRLSVDSLERRNLLAVTVFLDYDGPLDSFEDNLEEVADEADGGAVPYFDATEVSQIKANIKSGLETIFSGYDISFTETEPISGVFEDVKLYTSTVPGLYGQANIDPMNRVSGEWAWIFTNNFGDFVEYSDSRSTQITELSNAIANVTAHELDTVPILL
jgi:hypothetical protein